MLPSITLLLLAASCLQSGDDARLQGLVAELGSPDAAQRDRAEQELGKRWREAEPVLRKTRTDDTEVRARIERLLRKIEWNRNPPIAFLSPADRPTRILQALPLTGETRTLYDSGDATLWHLSWTPDAAKLVFFRSDAGLHAVSQSGEFELLARHHASSRRSTSQSPDGKRIAFVAKTEEEGKPPFEHVFIADTRTKEIGPLTRGGYNCYDPSWSPDGNSIVYVSDREGVQEAWDLFSHRPGEAEATRLTRDGKPKARPLWSPQGKDIAFELIPDSSSVAILSLDHNQVRTVSQGVQAAWSPDGRELVFVRGSTGETGNEIAVFNGQGAIRSVAGGQGDKAYPQWSPDGSRLAYQCHLNGETQVFVVDADGTNLRQLTRLQGGGLHPTWAPLKQ
jgi:dipeptidyl aminopeptidase/acylaminoacyl peptidase